jgi:hypothetical protein
MIDDDDNIDGKLKTSCVDGSIVILIDDGVDDDVVADHDGRFDGVVLVVWFALQLGRRFIFSRVKLKVRSMRGGDRDSVVVVVVVAS